MKRKGFTLIELLAVIVILAIIALIATPIIMNVIENARQSATARSFSNYLDSVNTLIASKRVEGKILDGTYDIDDNGNICLDENKCLEIEMNGTKPSDGLIVIENSEILPETTLIFNDYIAYNKNQKDIATKSICRLLSGENYTYGSKYICNLGDGELRNFYLLEDGDTTKLTKIDVDSYETYNRTVGYADKNEVVLLMDMNYNNETMTWCDPDGENPTNTDCNADGLSDILQSIRTAWLKLPSDKIGIPTTSQISQAGENSSKLEQWLVENLDSDLKTSIPSGYWTASKSNPGAVYRVREYGKDIQSIVVTNTDTGVRPIILLKKNQID